MYCKASLDFLPPVAGFPIITAMKPPSKILRSPSRQVDELIDHNRATESKLKSEERKENLVKIQKFVQENGYNTVLGVFLDELLISYQRQQQALNSGGITKILSFCCFRSISNTPIIAQEICRAGMIFEREIEQLVQSTELRTPMQVF